MNKKPVRIELSSVQTDGGEQLATRQTHDGTYYERDGASYLLYADDGTSTTVRMDPEEVRIYRRGEMESWQAFQLGELTGGHLAVGAGSMILRIMTSHFLVATGRLELHYELFTSETSAEDADPTALGLGKFTLSLSWSDLPC